MNYEENIERVRKILDRTNYDFLERVEKSEKVFEKISMLEEKVSLKEEKIDLSEKKVWMTSDD